jgi:sigma-B regulation protein RsbU (phosphoserine phosphatase)
MTSVESRVFIEGERPVADVQLEICVDGLTSRKHRTLEHDLARAGLIQQALLPRPNFIVNGWETCYHYAPAGQVGGDCCDLFEYHGGLLFLLGDVSGKGLAASLLMSYLQATIRSLADNDCPLDYMMESANRIFSQSTELGQFATLIVGHATRDGAVEFVSAGHLPLLHLCESGVSCKPATAVPLGVLSSTPFPIHRFSLDPGDALLLYTDGATESRNFLGEEFGVYRLRDIAANCYLAAPADLISECLSEVFSFATETERNDDMTLLVIQRTVQRSSVAVLQR